MVDVLNPTSGIDPAYPCWSIFCRNHYYNICCWLKLQRPFNDSVVPCIKSTIQQTFCRTQVFWRFMFLDGPIWLVKVAVVVGLKIFKDFIMTFIARLPVSPYRKFTPISLVKDGNHISGCGSWQRTQSPRIASSHIVPTNHFNSWEVCMSNQGLYQLSLCYRCPWQIFVLCECS